MRQPETHTALNPIRPRALWGQWSGLCLGLGVLLGGALTLVVPPALAQTAPLRILTVTGQGQERIPATVAQVQLGVEARGREATAVQAEVARRADAVVNYLRQQNVTQLETVGLQLSPQYDHSNNRTELVGYVGSNTIRFQFNAGAVGPILDGAIAAGATQIQGISFTASDGAIAAARQIALRRATADAQAQANAVLSQLNLGPQEVVGIQIDGAMGAIPIALPQVARFEGAQASFPTPVIAGEQTVEARVTLQIRY